MIPKRFKDELATLLPKLNIITSLTKLDVGRKSKNFRVFLSISLTAIETIFK